MEIIKREQAIRVEKPEGTRVNYYVFPEYEIHYNEVPPGVLQVWHHHSVVEETILMIEGELEARWKEGEVERHEIIQQGDAVRVEKTSHTFANISDRIATFVVVKLILDGVDRSRKIRGDKQVDE